MKALRVGVFLSFLIVTGSLQLPASARPTCGTPGASILSGTKHAEGALVCEGDDPPPGGKGNGKQVKGGAPPLCVWVPQPDHVALPGEPVNGPEGMWHAHFCKVGQFDTLEEFETEMASWGDFMTMSKGQLIRQAGIRYEFFKTPPPTRPTAEQVMMWIRGNLPFPQGKVAVNPVGAKNVVNIPTWFWLTSPEGVYSPTRFDAREKTLTLFGYALRWRIQPELTVNPGDGSEPKTCTGAGVKWSTGADQAAACTVSYRLTGRYTLTASVNWTVQWWLGEVRQPDLEGPTNTVTTAITVNEIETLNR